VEEADKHKRISRRAKGNFESKVIHLNQKPPELIDDTIVISSQNGRMQYSMTPADVRTV
jgi:hypothetical protein